MKVEHEGEVTILTVARQDALNALSPQVQRELNEALTELRVDEHGALLATGAGAQAFVVSADAERRGR